MKNRPEQAGPPGRAAIVIALLVLLFLPPGGMAETKVFDHTVDQPFSGSQSPDDAYMAAMTKAKFEVLELAGTYLESLSVVENAILTQDEVTALAGGVLTAEVVKKENYATDRTFGILLTTRIEVDTGVLHQRMEKLLTDRSLLRKYNEIQEREKELLARIRQLEAMNSQAETKAQPTRFDREFNDLSAALTASQWLEKAYALWSHGRFSDPQQAIHSLDQALVLDGDNPRTLNSRAVAYLGLGKFGEAEADLKKALTLKEDYADALNNLGSLHYRRGNYKAAVYFYSEAINLQCDFTEAILNRGAAFRKLFCFEDAVEDFRRAMLLAPADSRKKGNDAGSLVELNEIVTLCDKARTACSLNLCRSLEFLRERGFCLEKNLQGNTNL